MPDPETQELELDQIRRQRAERQAAETAPDDAEARQHARRAERAQYLREKLAERGRSEDELAG